MLAVDQRRAGKSAGRRQSRRGRPPSARRAHAPAWRRGWPRCRRQRDAAAAAPVGLEEPRRRDVLADEDGAGRRRCDIAAGRAAQHAVADVEEVGRAGAEIIVVGGLVAGDLRVERREPGRLGAVARSNQRERPGSVSASSASIATWNSRMSAARLRPPSIRPQSGRSRADRAFERALASRCRLPARMRATSASRSEQRTGGNTRPGRPCRSTVSRSADIGPRLRRNRADQRDQRVDGASASSPLGAEMQHGALRRLGGHHLDDALGVDPRPVGRERDLHAAAKVLASLVSFTDGRAWRPTSWVIRTDRFGDMPDMSSEFPFAHAGDSSSAVATTSQRGAARRFGRRDHRALDDRRVADDDLLRRGSPSISTAISLLVSAPPRSTRMATPASDQALSMAPMIDSTLVPSPPADCRRTRQAAPRRRPSGAPCRPCPRRRAANARR